MTALEEAKRLGCETVQIFTHAPRQWRRPRIGDEEAAAFRARQKECALYPLVVHTPYLPNLCTTSERLYLRSKVALKDDLEVCEKLGADFFVVHPGAYSDESAPEEGMKRLSDAFNEALSGPGKTRVLLENMAGGGRRLGSHWSELKRMLEEISASDRVGVCFDTAHTWGAGHAFSNAAEVDRTLDAVEQAIGLGRVYVIHANDTKAVHGSHRDLHQHIGQGKMGEEVFAALLADPRLKQCAVILETPKDDPAADMRNLATLRRLM